MANMKTGKWVMTAGINNDIADSTKFAKEITSFMKRYLKCDWGDMCEEDKAMNDDALKTGEDRIFAAYESSKGKVYIITEWDRSYTTVLYASEY